MNNIKFPEWFKEAEDLYENDKLPYYKIAEKIGVNRKTISYWLRKGGHVSNPKYVRNVVNTTRKYQVKDDVFNRIDTADKAYWLGFLYADGCILENKNSIELGVQERDKNILEQYLEFLESNYPIKMKKKYVARYDKTYIGYRVVVASKEILEDLVSHGCTPRKSLTLKWPNNLPESLVSHFIRGYYDGDGGVYLTNNKKTFSVEILGTPIFISSLKEKIPDSIVSYIHKFNHATGTVRIQIHGINAYRFLKWIYQGKKYYLKRKFEKFNNIAHLYRNVENVSEKIGEGLTANTEVTTRHNNPVVP